MSEILSIIIPISLTYFIFKYRKNKRLDDENILKNRMDRFYKEKKSEKR